MKTNKILKVMCTVVIIILLICISFIGIYVTQKNQKVNIVKDYSFGMELGGAREIVLMPSDDKVTKYYDEEGKTVDVTNLSEEEKEKYTEKEEPVNTEEVLKTENYIQAKKVFQKRMENAGIQEYTMSVDETTGNIVIKTLETDTLDNIIYSIFNTGEFRLEDTDTGEVLLNNQNLKNAQVGYYNATSGTSIYLTLNLNKEGGKKLEDISSQYVETKDEEGNSTKKTVTLYLNGEEITTTYFAEQIKTGQIQLTVGSEIKDSETMQAYVLQAGNMATTLNNGLSPVTYEISDNNYVGTSISEQSRTIALFVMVIAITLMLTYLIVEHRDRGIIAAITFLGYIAALLLVIRYSNTMITFESIAAIILAVIFNFLFLNVILQKLNHYKNTEETPKGIMNQSIMKAMLVLIPALIISVVFCFMVHMGLNSFGIALFWGVAMFIVYTFLITKTLLLNFEYLFED